MSFFSSLESGVVKISHGVSEAFKYYNPMNSMFGNAYNLVESAVDKSDFLHEIFGVDPKTDDEKAFTGKSYFYFTNARYTAAGCHGTASSNADKYFFGLTGHQLQQALMNWPGVGAKKNYAPPFTSVVFPTNLCQDMYPDDPTQPYSTANIKDKFSTIAVDGVTYANWMCPINNALEFGPLTRIDIKADEHRGVIQFEQYFGDVYCSDGLFYADAPKVTLSLSPGEAIVRTDAIHFLNDDKYKNRLAAIRLVTNFGQDTGYIGSIPKDNAAVSIYRSVHNNADLGPQSGNGSFGAYVEPILGFALLPTSGKTQIMALAPVFTCRSETQFSAVNPADSSQSVNITLSEDSSTVNTRTFSYTNGGSIAQEVEAADSYSVTTKHTLTKSDTESNSVTTSFSLSGTAFLDALIVTGSYSQSSTTSLVQTTTEDISTTDTATRYYNYVFTVEPNTQLEATVTVYEQTASTKLWATVTWLKYSALSGLAPAASENAVIDEDGNWVETVELFYQGRDSFRLSVDLKETALKATES